MPLFGKLQQDGDTWILLDGDGNRIGRIWDTSHVDRVVRDGTLAEAIQDGIAAGGTTARRRQAVRDAVQEWATGGGHSVDLANVTLSLENPPGSGNMDGKRHIFLAGQHVGYLDLPDPDDGRHGRLRRVIRLAEELFSGEQLGAAGQRNAALDAALTRFTDDGGLG